MPNRVQQQNTSDVARPWDALQRVISRRRQRRSSVYTPKLARLWIVLPIWLAAGAGLIWLIDRYVRTNEALVGTNTPQIEITKVVLTFTAGVGAVLAGVYAYRKQRLEEGSSHRADAASFADRYNSAVEQLGSDAAAIRLAGAYAMARLADDWADQRQVCVDVLCGYLRMQRPASGAAADSDRGQEQEVRATIQTLITTHLRDPLNPRSWSSLNFNFERARLVNLDLTGATFTGAMTSFERATFSGTRTLLSDATFSSPRTTFAGAIFSGGWTSFFFATFSGDTTRFDEATFSSDTTTFHGTTFSGDTTSFERATFTGDTTTFHGATFTGTRTTFSAATFSSDVTTFLRASFTGDTTTFAGATFSGTRTSFDEAKFSDDSPPTFDKAKFSGDSPPTFLRATSFEEATFSSDTTSFVGATFSSPRTSFHKATFSGAELYLPLTSLDGFVNFSRAIWHGPGTFSFDSVANDSPSTSLRVAWDDVNLLDGARVTLDGNPFRGWPPSHPAGPQ